MSAPLRLQADDRDVLARTAEAVRESNRNANIVLTVRCIGARGRCRATLAQIGVYPSGILFASHWIEPTTRTALVEDGRDVDPLELKRRDLSDAQIRALTFGDGLERPNGVIALLNLPPTMVADYPDLLVRCRKHGDAVVDRPTIIEHCRDRVPELHVDCGGQNLVLPADSRWLVDPAD